MTPKEVYQACMATIVSKHTIEPVFVCGILGRKSFVYDDNIIIIKFDPKQENFELINKSTNKTVLMFSKEKCQECASYEDLVPHIDSLPRYNRAC